MPGERLVELMQRAARGQEARGTPTDFVFGTVKSIAPLVIQVDEKFPVYEEQLILSALCKSFTTTVFDHLHSVTVGGDGHTHTGSTDNRLRVVEVWRGLLPGDRVRMLQCNSGQKYYVLDREGSLP